MSSVNCPYQLPPKALVLFRWSTRILRKGVFDDLTCILGKDFEMPSAPLRQGKEGAYRLVESVTLTVRAYRKAGWFGNLKHGDAGLGRDEVGTTRRYGWSNDRNEKNDVSPFQCETK